MLLRLPIKEWYPKHVQTASGWISKVIANVRSTGRAGETSMACIAQHRAWLELVVGKAAAMVETKSLQ